MISIDSVIDLSHWNSDISPVALKAAGVQAIYHKATEMLADSLAMKGGVDQQYARRKELYTAAGFRWGAYAFGNATDGAKQADFLLSTVKYDGTFRLALDLESGMNLAQAESFVQRIYDLTKLWPDLYTRASYIIEIAGYKDTILANCDLWIADPNSSNAPVIPYQWRSKGWRLWQRRQKLIGGTSVDRNDFNGNGDSTLIEWWDRKPTPIVPMPADASRFRAPVGDGSLWLPQPTSAPLQWYSANNYDALYVLDGKQQRHTGVDLNMANDADAHQPVYAAANGRVTFAQQVLNSTWGNMIVIQHVTLTGEMVWTRYAHLDSILVNVGDNVILGQQIAAVGNGFNKVPYHLHFDVAKSSVLNKSPIDWPGMDEQRILNDYYDPYMFIRDHMAASPVPPVNRATRYVSATDSLLVRNAGTRTAPVLLDAQGNKLALAYNTAVDVDLNSLNAEHYVKLLDRTGWVSADWLSTTKAAPTTPAPTPSPISRKHSAISLHIMTGARLADVSSLLRTCSSAGRPLPAVTLVRLGWGNDIKASDIKAASPSTRIVYRWYRQDWDQRSIDWSKTDMRKDGANWCEGYYQAFLAPDGDYTNADYQQIINEPAWGVGTASWWEGAIDVALAHKIKLAIGCFSSGTPPLPGESGDIWPSMYDVLRRAKAQGHILMLHEYTNPNPDPANDWTNQWTMKRYRAILNSFPADLKDMPVVFGEFGTVTATGLSDDKLRSGLQQADSYLKNDPNVLSANLWSVGGGGGWGESLLDGRLGVIQDYLLHS